MKTVNVTRRMLEKAVKAVLGPTGRVWKGKDMWSIGQELNPGRLVHGSGPTMIEAWSEAFLDQDAIKAEAARIEALRGVSLMPHVPEILKEEIVAHMPNGEATEALAQGSETP